MTRYYFYFYLICMLINTIFFVPRILLAQRFDGAIMALIAAVGIGTALAVTFTKSIGRFPGKGLPEIFAGFMPLPIRTPILIFMGIMWIISGSIIIIAFSFITNRYLSPETSPQLLLICFCGICSWASTRKASSIISVTEIIILVNLPIVAFIMYKSFSQKLFDWDSVKIMTDYVFVKPSWSLLAAATYPFSGYINFAIYNRYFKELKVTHLWLVPVIGAFVLFTSIVVPIGLLGTSAVGDYLYTWISAADTLRMQYGFIERVVFLFLFIYIGFSLLFVTICWNIGIQLICGCLPDRLTKKKRSRIVTYWCIAGVNAAVTFWTGVLSNDKGMINFVKIWLNLRLGSEIALVALMAVLAWLHVSRRRNREHA
ncbi:hypothetical protein [Cohnella sp. GbtcB17]|uniref:hypothetical protein n=1 Tax=Cohnella sp. GbtcB17 TaxID=2824762 RepID=UPI001C2F9CA1|nr:hypothetical protein [Cohnella sp. GbtcB17]